MPSSASVDIAAAVSAVRSSTSRSASASTSMPSIPSVPLISARPSLARSVSGATPAVVSAVAPSTNMPSARRASPSPSSTSAADASGARSPLAPSEPCSRTTGVTPAFEQGEHRVDHEGAGAGVAHRQAAGAQQHHRPDRLPLDLLSHAGGVRADERRLQLGRALGRDHRVGQRTEAGGHAVDRLGLVNQALDHRGAALHDARAPRRRARPGDPCARPRPRPRPSRRADRAPAASRSHACLLTPPYFIRVSLIAAARASSSTMPASTTSPTKSVCVPRSWAARTAQSSQAMASTKIGAPVRSLADAPAVQRHRLRVEHRRLGELDEHLGVVCRPQVDAERAARRDQPVGDSAVVDADADEHRLHRQLGDPARRHPVPLVAGPGPDQRRARWGSST